MKKISILEDLIPLFPTSPFKLYLDVKNNEKNVCILSESLIIQYSDELQPTEQEKSSVDRIWRQSWHLLHLSIYKQKLKKCRTFLVLWV